MTRSILSSFFALIFTVLLNRNDKVVGVVNPYPYEFILQAEACTAEVEILIVIHTSPKLEYSHRRVAMRATWLNRKWLSLHLNRPVKSVFFAGRTNDNHLQLRLQYESELYADIVQSSFTDSYEANTYKSMSYLLWTSKYCSRAQLLMKIDDDCLLKTQRVPELRQLIEKLIEKKTAIYAGRIVDLVPNRNKKSKWYVSTEVWPHDYYPLWFQGLVYFLTPRHAGLLFNTSLHTRYMHTDDVFVGIIVNRTPAVSQQVIPITALSEYANEHLSIVSALSADWNKGMVKFFHVPDLGIYYSWAAQDMSVKIPFRWFVW